MKHNGAILFIFTSVLLTFCSKRETRIEYYPNNKSVKSQIEYVDGKRNGEERDFFPNGKIKLIQQWKDDKAEGKCVEYFENGLTLINFYENDKKAGTGNYYVTSTGQLAMKAIYDENGEEIDIIVYEKDGSQRKNEETLMVNALPDTIGVQDTFRLQIRLTNISDYRLTHGSMLIGKFKDDAYFPHRSNQLVEFDGPVVEIKSNESNYVYKEKAKSQGGNTVQGQLFYRLTEDSIVTFPFSVKYYVK